MEGSAAKKINQDDYLGVSGLKQLATLIPQNKLANEDSTEDDAANASPEELQALKPGHESIVAKPVAPVEKTKVFSFFIEDHMQNLDDLRNQYKDVIEACQYAVSSYGLKPSSEDSSLYLRYETSLKELTKKYLNYLQSLTKANTFEYEEGDENKTNHRGFVDFYRIAVEMEMVTIPNRAVIDANDVFKQMEKYLKSIDRLDIHKVHAYSCICAVCFTMKKGNFSASPLKQLETILSHVNQH